MENNALNRGLETSGVSGELSLKWLLIISFSMNIFLQGAMYYMSALIRSLQIVLHLPIINIIIPGNVLMTFGYIFPVVMFDVLDPDWTTNLVFSFDDSINEVSHTQKLEIQSSQS